MFDCYHYVPVLKWKRGERIALRKLADSIRQWVTPVIEVVAGQVEPGNRLSRDAIQEIVMKTLVAVKKDWGPKPFFLDLRFLDSRLNRSDAEHMVQAAVTVSAQLSLSMIIVTGPERSKEVNDALGSVMKNRSSNICVRIAGADIGKKDFGGSISQLLTRIGRSKSEVHLILDYGSTPHQMQDLASLESRIEDLDQYQTYTTTSCAFPQNLSDLEKNRQHILPRRDWTDWRRLVSDQRVTLKRRPAYGDYSIIHPDLAELPKFVNVSASIRYTSEDSWVIMRGEGLRNVDGPGFMQYPAQAALLCGRAEFCGASFSAGDAYIQELSQHVGSSKGTPESLIQAGINHHITFVVRQLATLCGRADAL